MLKNLSPSWTQVYYNATGPTYLCAHVDDIIIVKTTEHMNDCIGGLDITQKLIP